VFAVSRADLAALERLQRAYLAEMRTIIARSEPSEVVALASFQLITLGASPFPNSRLALATNSQGWPR
jgi:hypothetical protein